MPTDASAKGWKHHHHHHGFHGHWGPRIVIGGGYYGGCYVKRLVETPYGLRYRTVKRVLLTRSSAKGSNLHRARHAPSPPWGEGPGERCWMSL